MLFRSPAPRRAASDRELAEADERARLAEAKATKAIAAARAAAAGLTVSSADLDKLEAGLGVTPAPRAVAAVDRDEVAPAKEAKGVPMGAVAGAFGGGIAAVLIGLKLFGGGAAKPAQPAQPPAPPAPAAAVAPTVTPAPAPAAPTVTPRRFLFD